LHIGQGHKRLPVLFMLHLWRLEGSHQQPLLAKVTDSIHPKKHLLLPCASRILLIHCVDNPFLSCSSSSGTMSSGSKSSSLTVNAD
jgi:hypothetical protein